ncbi:early nodulin-93-like [Hibiscus syriacus]|uniref:non-specific serine/threonine protein kinase n=1 Tax=Hibiscus syriacus TaxID=106335 RepID=A0A6A3BWL8_HIBSY|nr:protein kinase PINOID 2-like [Hibiscus syriacus]KAE8721143.1 early nodulin-93-like [Hibiscus syriacus]
MATPSPDSSSHSNLSFSRNQSSSSLGSTNHKPHKGNHPAWAPFDQLLSEHGQVEIQHFKLLHRIGCGGMGNVYVCEINNTAIESNHHHPHCLYAMKVVDMDQLKAKKKLHRHEMERNILGMLDHPFLPTLYAEFNFFQYSCLVMEYCPGGDLLTLMQHQPDTRFPLPSAKFYAAEVLVALEYLHMMGVIYRDLKPENVLVQEDGHIMLTDLDLSLKCDVSPKLLKCNASSIVDKYYSHLSLPNKKNKMKHSSSSSPSASAILLADIQKPEVQLWAEPTDARSGSFVGTREYLAPEVIRGLGHGNGVDWWAFGVFLYELLYGKTPFEGECAATTMTNILGQPVTFPRICSGYEMGKAHDLIRKLLVKDPNKRMGSLWGAVEIKRHGFFKGLDWALIRSLQPPQIKHPTQS